MDPGIIISFSFIFHLDFIICIPHIAQLGPHEYLAFIYVNFQAQAEHV